MTMRDDMEAAELRAMEARSRRREELATMVGSRVRHAYTAARTGTVTRAYLTRNGRSRVMVAWDGGKTTAHDVALIREAPPQRKERRR